MIKSQSSPWVFTFLTNALILAFGTFTGILTARLLHPEGRGALAAVLFWPEILAGVGICGLNEALVYRMGQGKESADGIRTAVVSALGLAAVTIAAGLLLMPYLLGQARAMWINAASGYLVFFIPLNFLSLTLLAVDQAQLRFHRYNLLKLSVPMVYVIGFVGLWVFHAVSVETVLWANLIGNAIGAGIRIGISRHQLAGKFSFNEAKSLTFTGLSFHATLLVVLLSSRIDRILVLALWDNATVGLYIAAFTYSASALSIITNTVHTIVFPRIANSRDDAQGCTLLSRALRISMLVITLGTIPMIALAPWLVPGLFGVDFKAAIVPSVLLLAAYIPLAMRQIIVRSVRGFGEARLGVAVEGLSVVLFLTAVYPLGRHFGLLGVAGALLVANTICLLCSVAYLQRTFDIGFRDWWGLDMVTLRDVVGYARNSVAGALWLRERARVT
jgi:O-antigen/teichoic acid export membrane protein